MEHGFIMQTALTNYPQIMDPHYWYSPTH